ncbi:putative mitochondrial protein AtMg00240 [Primulina tabacum]|uniref:putative mitochondrial protein AtMg00240 n=1 Tax=Primulina tabacum TaxID=48773 RepID=UPI003F5A804E
MEQNKKLTSHELDSAMERHQKHPPADALLVNPGEYQCLVGRLIYLTITRPDICYAVQFLSQFMHAPKASHLDAAIRVVKYIKKNPGQGILFQPSTSLSLTAYCDSDWAACPMSRRSVTGYCIKLGTSLLSWKSKETKHDLTIISRS